MPWLTLGWRAVRLSATSPLKIKNLKPTRQIISTDFVSRQIYPWNIGNLGRERVCVGDPSRKILSRGAGRRCQRASPLFEQISIFPLSPSVARSSLCPTARWRSVGVCDRVASICSGKLRRIARLVASMPKARGCMLPLLWAGVDMIPSDSGFTRRQRGCIRV